MSATDTASMIIDAFPYSHRVGEIMTTPLVTIDRAAPLSAAIALMHASKVSSLVIDPAGSADVRGILTEHDTLKAIARSGADALGAPVAAAMSSPVESIGAEEFIYKALGRLERHDLRHLPVHDAHGVIIGMLTARTLLRERVTSAMVIGDAIEEAETAAELEAAHDVLPRLAETLLAEELRTRTIAAVISGVMRDLTARAAKIAEREMAEEGRGPPPARYSVLVLGSGGRGESLLAPDQDNAIIHDGTDADDPWFAELGERFSRHLDAAGVPFCKGGVMAAKPLWRGTLAGWMAKVEHWIRSPTPTSLLNADIFFDFQPVAGDLELAHTLRRGALARTCKDPSFQKALALQLAERTAPIDMFGRLKTVEGRIDLKFWALLPIVATARIGALSLGFEGTSTMARLAAMAQAEIIVEEDLERYGQVLDLAMELILRQQIRDRKRGDKPTTKVEAIEIGHMTTARLKDGLKRVTSLALTARDIAAGGARRKPPVSPRR